MRRFLARIKNRILGGYIHRQTWLELEDGNHHLDNELSRHDKAIAEYEAKQKAEHKAEAESDEQ